MTNESVNRLSRNTTCIISPNSVHSNAALMVMKFSKRILVAITIISLVNVVEYISIREIKFNIYIYKYIYRIKTNARYRLFK